MLINRSRPALEIYADISRYYKKKNTNKLKLSKKPVVEISNITSDMSLYPSCREILIDKLRTKLENAIINKKVESNPYKLIPTAYIEDLDIPLKFLIKMIPTNMNDMKMIKSKKNQDILKEVLNYILGIIGVCFYHQKDEVLRRENNVGTSGNISIYKDEEETYNIDYNVLSPKFMTSPILISFISGLARDCIGTVSGLPKDIINKELLSKYDKKEIDRVINETDYKTAKKIFNKTLIPFFSKHFEINGLLSSKNKITTLKELVDKDTIDIFRPNRTINHWRRYSNLYGYNRFSSYIRSPYSVLLYDNYRRV
jgi:hypothetical protein